MSINHTVVENLGRAHVVGRILLLAAMAFLVGLRGMAQTADEPGQEPEAAQVAVKSGWQAAPAKESKEPGTTTVKRKPPMLEIKKVEKEFEVHGALVGFYQGSTTAKIDGQDVNADNGSGFGAAADLQMTYRPTVSFFENSFFFVRVLPGTGKGADQHVGAKLFANLNSIADYSDALQTNFDNVFWLNEAYYVHTFADGKLAVGFGKAEPFVVIDDNAFANNPYSQFVGKPFVNNPVLNSEDQTAPIVGAKFTPIESISIAALGVSSSYPNAPVSDQKSIYSRIADQPLVAVQLTYSPKFGELQGNYRVYYWNATYPHKNSGGATSPDGSGVGVSFDQMITETLGLFARVAYSDKHAYDTDWFWSVGTNLKGLIPSRQNDELGIGIAELKGTVGPDNLGSEFHFETYYRIYLMKYFAVSPDIQYVANPLGNTHNGGVVAGMIRLESSF